MLDLLTPETIAKPDFGEPPFPHPLAPRKGRAGTNAPTESLIASGVRIPLDRRIVTPPIEAALRNGTYEADETRSLPQVVQSGDRVLELGAGMGFVSTILANRTEAAKIIAMEANPLLIPFIRGCMR